MAIGFLSSQPIYRKVVWLAVTGTFLVLSAHAADQIKRKDGNIIPGTPLYVSGQQVWVNTPTPSGQMVKQPFYLSDIATVTMAPPADFTKAAGAPPATVITLLEPLVKSFAGLPSDWVVQAMGQLADAYSTQNQGDKALALYTQIDTLYPGSKYHLQAVAGKASLTLKQGKVDEALAAIQPVIDEAGKNLAPSRADGGLYATAYLVYGQALEAQHKNAQALEAYLTVKTMFYQNTTLADQADQLARKLRDQNPGLGVD